MSSELATPELAAYFRAALKMLDADVAGEELLVNVVKEGRESVATPVQVLRELTPLETECILLDFSLAAASLTKLMEAAVIHGGRPPKGLVTTIHAMSLHKTSCAFVAILMSQVEAEARASGAFPIEKADVVCLDIRNDALCISAGKRLPDARHATVAEHVADKFDLKNWRPADGKMN